MYIQLSSHQGPSVFKSPVFQGPGIDLIQEPRFFRATSSANVKLDRDHTTHHSSSSHNDPATDVNEGKSEEEHYRSNTDDDHITAGTHNYDSTFPSHSHASMSEDQSLLRQQRAFPHPTNPRKLKSSRPLPPSEIRSLKAVYDNFQTTIGDPLDHLRQVRLSRALNFDMSRYILASTISLLSELPFFESSSLAPAETSWMKHHRVREARLAELSQTSRTMEVMRKLWAEQRAGPVPTIVRCGAKGSKTPILVRWTNATGDSYEVYDEKGPMPRQVRKLLFDEWEEQDRPFGVENIDWQIDDDGKVWLRDRRRGINELAKWWILER